MSREKRLPLVAFISLSIWAWGPASAGATQAQGETITAVVVKSWGACSSNFLIWESLNATWEQYGDTPINIDYAYPGLCDGPVEYRSLVASGADVLILSDPSGGGQQWQPDEIRALERYVRAGHTVIGTFLLFRYANVDNRGLAPLFGLPRERAYTVVSVDPTYDLLEPDNPLFASLPDPYASTGYPNSQLPLDNSWDVDDLAGARFVGLSGDSQAAILLNQRTSYTAVFITSMPEYGGGPQDHQFLYNAITYRFG